LSKTFEKTSLSTKLIETPFISAFFRATLSASLEISTAVTKESGKAFFKAIAIAPLPVPISKIFKFFIYFSFI